MIEPIGAFLVWGVVYISPDMSDTDKMFEKSVEVATQAGIVDPGDTIVITAGIPIGISGTTNLIKVSQMGIFRCSIEINPG